VIGQLSSVDDVNRLLKHCMASIFSLFNSLSDNDDDASESIMMMGMMKQK